MQKKTKMIIAVSQASTMATLGKGQISFFKNHGFEVDLLAKNDNEVESAIQEGANFFEIGFRRAMSPMPDLKALNQIIKVFKKNKPQVVQMMTLKPSILGSLAGRFTGVPVLIRHKWGNMRESNYSWLKKYLLFFTDKLSNKLAHQIVVICHKLLESELEIKAIDSHKAVVYGSGSSNGLDLNRFKRTDEIAERGRRIRDELGIWLNAPVLGTVMRINIEKGICELIDAFLSLSEKLPKLRLIVVGDYDIRNLPPQHYIDTISNHAMIHHVGWQMDIEKYYAAMDIFVMPSYREGFCKSNIEASGMGLPVVATNIIGCSESVKDGVSGILVPPRDSKALASAIKTLLIDKELANKLGKQGRERVEAEFDQQYVWHNQLRDICQLLQAKNITPPINPELILRTICPLCS